MTDAAELQKELDTYKTWVGIAIAEMQQHGAYSFPHGVFARLMNIHMGGIEAMQREIKEHDRAVRVAFAERLANHVNRGWKLTAEEIRRFAEGARR